MIRVQSLEEEDGQVGIFTTVPQNLCLNQEGGTVAIS